jgi:hypothetical protein
VSLSLPVISQRLSYEVKGIATLYDWLLPSGHCFQPDAGPDLSQLQGLSVQCLGVWGSLEDIMGFLRAKLRTRQTVLRKVRGHKHRPRTHNHRYIPEHAVFLPLPLVGLCSWRRCPPGCTAATRRRTRVGPWGRRRWVETMGLMHLLSHGHSMRMLTLRVKFGLASDACLSA